MSSLDWLPVAIRQRSTTRDLGAGETLFRQGHKASAIFEVEQGRLRLIRHTIDSHPIVLHTAREGQLFAEAALFAAAYHCDAVAAIASRVRVYPKASCWRPSAAILRWRNASWRYWHTRSTRFAPGWRSNIRSARKRVLHRVALAAGKDGRTMRLEGTLMNLAAELGLTHEVLYRALAELEKAGVIARTGSAIILRKKDDV